MADNIDSLIFGKNNINNVVSIEILKDNILVFTEDEKGSKFIHNKNKYWILFSQNIPGLDLVELDGNLHYRYIKYFDKKSEYNKIKMAFRQTEDIYYCTEEREAAMLLSGITYYKNTKIENVGVLGFDIEATTLNPYDKDARVLLISNTYRKGNRIEKKLFAYDEYHSDMEFFNAWCSWVQEMDPSVMCGHFIYGYDLPYLNACAIRAGCNGLRLGRLGKELEFDDYESKFRFDGSQQYEYHNARIFGREIVDTMFMAMKYDIGRKYPNYRLKDIIKFEEKEKTNRTFYDASKIRENYLISEEWIKIKEYCNDDSDDAITLFDLMSPSYFYLARSIPKPFQWIINKATGSMINSFMVRGYLQNKHSIPKADQKVKYPGARTEGNPGVYHNVFKVDVASLYPSIILTYDIYDERKDPNKVFLTMVRYFTAERLQNKKLAQQTKDKYYKDMSEAQKIVINSAYGMMGAEGLNFNSPPNAAKVTKIGQDILTKSIDWAIDTKDCLIVNADTDSIAFCYKDFRNITDEQRKQLLSEINTLYPKGIHWEDDGYYVSFVVLKKKNYATWTMEDPKFPPPKGKVTIKGSALKSSKTEKAFKEYQEKMLHMLLEGRKEEIPDLYLSYVYEILNIDNINRFASRKTITEKVMDAKRTTEKKIMEAVGDRPVSQGDKIWVYFDRKGALKLVEDYSGDADTQKLLGKLYGATKAFSAVIDMNQLKRYNLKKNFSPLMEDGVL